MAQTLTIDRFQCRYRLPASRLAERGRIDAILAELTADALEQVAEGAGTDPHTLICIRRLEVPVALRFGSPDGALLDTWTAAFATALHGVIASGEAESFVRYPSRFHALVDVGAGVATGERQRAWAWHQLGLWPAYDPADPAGRVDAFVAALVQEPPAVIGVLVALAEQGVLEALATQLVPAAWVELAAAALAAAGAAPGLAAPAPASEVASSELVAAVRGRRALASSPLAPVVAACASVGLPAEATAAAASLAVLAGEPALVVWPRVQLQAAIVGAAQALAPVGSPLASEPERGATGEADLLRPKAAAEADGEPPKPRSADATGAPSPTHDADRVAADDDESTREAWQTPNGGLLLLLGLVDELGLPDRIAADPTLGTRPLPEVLRTLATLLAPIDCRDPAVAAFCGLHDLDALNDLATPDDLADGERQTLAALASEVSAELERRFGEDDAPELATLHLRDAQIYADPSWIEVRLRHDQASVAARRARLDLDPGWLPWLGAVVRFVYA